MHLEERLFENVNVFQSFLQTIQHIKESAINHYFLLLFSVVLGSALLGPVTSHVVAACSVSMYVSMPSTQLTSRTSASSWVLGSFNSGFCSTVAGIAATLEAARLSRLRDSCLLRGARWGWVRRNDSLVDLGRAAMVGRATWRAMATLQSSSDSRSR